MPRIVVLILTGASVGPTSVGPGVIRAMECKGVRLDVFRPIAQPRIGDDAPDQTTTIAHTSSSTTTAAEPLKMSYVEGLLSSNQRDVLMEGIIVNCHASTKDAEVVLVEGLAPTCKHQFTQSLNCEIVRMLNAEIVSVMSQGTDTPEQLKGRIELTRNSFGDAKNTNITGVIVNKLNAPVDEQGRTRPDLSEIFDDSTKARVDDVDPAKLRESSPLLVFGAVPWSFDLIATYAVGMARHLDVTITNEGNINTCRIKSVIFCARSIPHMLKHSRVGSLLVTSADCPDALVVACLVAMNGVEIGALLLTDGYEMGTRISKLYEYAFTTGLPAFMANTDTRQTSLGPQSFNPEVSADDHERIERTREYMANYINADWINSLTATSGRNCRLSPPAFHYQLTELTRKADKRIVLPESDEPRTVKVVAICTEHGIATCVLLGSPTEINRVAVSQGMELGAGIKIVDPEVARENYAGRLVEPRKNKGMIETVVHKRLGDDIVLGALVLKQDEVDGLVSSAVRITANAIRSLLQLIKTVPDGLLVPSMSFMLLPEQVYVYGDCAINPDPTAEQLAETTAQSANSATAFGIEPRVAMLSYSTGTSGAGDDIEKVREATRSAQEKRPDPMTDGPLQYDAAIMADVAKSKAPNFPVAGRATVFIFPGLNTGNTAYKVVQRSADLISIGPMLQGIRKPTNDLSRGVLVDDIVYAVALTAIQFAQQQ